MRDITLIIGNEKNDKIISFLEKWYFKHKRKMNEDEMKYVAELLNTDQETI